MNPTRTTRPDRRETARRVSRRTARLQLAPQIFIEEVEGALPGQLGGGLVIARRSVVVEAVIGTGVNISVVGDVVGFERLFVSGPSAGDAGVQSRIVKQQRGANLGGIFGSGLRAVERPRRRRDREAWWREYSPSGRRSRSPPRPACRCYPDGISPIPPTPGNPASILFSSTLVKSSAPSSSVRGYSPAEVRPSGAKAMKLATANRRATSSM